ncbi:MAG: S8 family serine peptidase, partial [Saprospiraceae bacterium]
YNNTGQSGGTPGADIDMDEAWDIATGGLTPMGDTIVAAVIDDGINIGHTDFGSNRWYNYAEIPNDGIDNDNNGYVDDYLGWDSYNDNDSVEESGSHGTPVAGIVGAKGNNGNGVAGVNWDVKLMIIQGGGNEANALAAYGYAYSFRKRYNETGGQEGAYVVATNASWGTDFGQAADAPLWCGFYDILGQEGVINCGATINGNNNVDVEGDLPTTCPSDYLIAVTNMNHNDVKVTGAGYGSTHIDLGAFGDGTYAPSITNSYGGFGGTSGATPHVTGVAALMHSVNCPSFTALMKADPAAATLLIKQYILDGVDNNASLSGISVTEGRLNAKNALQAIMDNCSPSNCYVPYYLLTSNITDTSVDLDYTVGPGTDLVHLQYRILGTPTWTTISNIGNAP